MKRSEPLQDLSRDHHEALAVALGLRRATSENVDAAIRRFRGYFQPRGARHFDVEEAVLLPVLEELDGGRALSARIRAEHTALRMCAAELAGAARESEQLDVAVALGRKLDAHVRFEEREVFPLLETRLAPGELEDLGIRLSDAEAEHETR